jgi:hypothetical protein
LLAEERMSSSKPADSTPIAISVAVALGVLLLLVGGLVAFFMVRRERVARDVAMAERMHAQELERQALAQARAHAPAGASELVAASPVPPAAGVLEQDPELQAFLLIVLQEHFAWRAGEPPRNSAELALVARQLSAAIGRSPRPAQRERELRRECAWAFQAAGLPGDAERELERALALTGPEDGAVRAEIANELQAVRAARSR